ncbi:MAG: hypothetical protein IKA44_06820 [Clostridia bacterium]|nr:hypothetical protein [Clostridia bacterium]
MSTKLTGSALYEAFGGIGDDLIEKYAPTGAKEPVRSPKNILSRLSGRMRMLAGTVAAAILVVGVIGVWGIISGLGQNKSGVDLVGPGTQNSQGGDEIKGDMTLEELVKHANDLVSAECLSATQKDGRVTVCFKVNKWHTSTPEDTDIESLKLTYMSGGGTDADSAGQVTDAQTPYRIGGNYLLLLTRDVDYFGTEKYKFGFVQHDLVIDLDNIGASCLGDRPLDELTSSTVSFKSGSAAGLIRYIDGLMRYNPTMQSEYAISGEDLVSAAVLSPYVIRVRVEKLENPHATTDRLIAECYVLEEMKTPDGKDVPKRIKCVVPTGKVKEGGELILLVHLIDGTDNYFMPTSKVSLADVEQYQRIIDILSER